MSVADTTVASQTDAIAFEFDLHHSPKNVWRALTDPTLLADWLLPVIDLELDPGAAFTFKTQPYPGSALSDEPRRWASPFDRRSIHTASKKALQGDRRRSGQARC